MTDKERIEVYVNELPENCWDCPCHKGENGRCKLNGDYTDYRPANCPLKTIQSVQNQKAVEALREAYNYAIKHYNEEEKDMKVAVAYRKCATKISELLEEYGGKGE